MQTYYQHFTVLSQQIIELTILIATKNNEIRSYIIQNFLFNFGIIKREITVSWINQLLRREGIKRIQGRPTKKCKSLEGYYLVQIERIYREYIGAIGISVMQDLFYHFKLEASYIQTLKLIKNNINMSTKKVVSWKESTMKDYLLTEIAIALTRGVCNYEEAINADIEHSKMPPKQAREMVKKLELCDAAYDIIEENHYQYWLDFLKLDQKQQKIYFDGHCKPYYTKQTHLCGVMSVSGKVMPGTKYVVATNEDGYLIYLKVIPVNNNYGDAVYHIIKRMCKELQSVIELVIMDREGCGAELNKKILKDFKVYSLSPIRANQYKSLDDFDYVNVKDNIYCGKWHNKAKSQKDSRLFIIIKYKDRLCVFATTWESIDCKTVALLYKTRWPNNEEIIKNANMQVSFNTNVSNGTEVIKDPKVLANNKDLKKKIKNHEDKKELYQQKQSDAKINCTKKRFKNQIQNAENRIDGYKNQIINDDQIRQIKQRATKPDFFVATLKSSILNLYRYILKTCLPEQKNPAMEKMFHLFINRKGYIVNTTNTKQYIFNRPSTLENISILEKFCKNFNKLNITDRNNKQVMLKVAIDTS